MNSRYTANKQLVPYNRQPPNSLHTELQQSLPPAPKQSAAGVYNDAKYNSFTSRKAAWKELPLLSRGLHTGGAQTNSIHSYIRALGAATASSNTPNTNKISYSARSIQKGCSYPFTSQCTGMPRGA